MGERKIINKYIPADFDPRLVPRSKKPKDALVSVRMMLPFSIQCQTCSSFMYAGRKFKDRTSPLSMAKTYLEGSRCSMKKEYDNMEVMAHCLVISVRTVHRAWTSGNFSVKYCVSTPGLVKVSHTSSYNAKRRLLRSDGDVVTEGRRSDHRPQRKEPQ